MKIILGWRPSSMSLNLFSEITLFALAGDPYMSYVTLPSRPFKAQARRELQETFRSGFGA